MILFRGPLVNGCQFLTLNGSVSIEVRILVYVCIIESILKRKKCICEGTSLMIHKRSNENKNIFSRFSILGSGDLIWWFNLFRYFLFVQWLFLSKECEWKNWLDILTGCHVQFRNQNSPISLVHHHTIDTGFLISDLV